MQRYYVDGLSPRVLVTDSVTILEPGDAEAVIVSASHGGVSSAQFVLGRSIRAVIYNDAGVGKDGAGIAGLEILETFGLPAATVDARSARIGEGEDSWTSGVISHANAAALALGVEANQAVQAAAPLLARAPIVSGEGQVPRLTRRELQVGQTTVLLIDSISMLGNDGTGRIVVSGSHGGVVSGEFALRHRPRLTVFNDAGIGRGEAGVAALALLEASGCAAVAIDAGTGRIGDPTDMLEHGRVSRANRHAVRLGISARSMLAGCLAQIGDMPAL